MRPTDMGTIQSNRTAARIEAVDNWHQRWKDVLRVVQSTGRSGPLKVDRGGWLSARQVLLVAFVEEAVAAHLCFSISVAPSGRIEATLDGRGIDRRFAGRGIEDQLQRAAMSRAKALRCETLRGFKQSSEWSM